MHRTGKKNHNAAKRERIHTGSSIADVPTIDEEEDLMCDMARPFVVPATKRGAKS